MEIYPSLISSDLLNLRQTISELDTVCHGYHIDIMDDHFVPNLTWGAQFVNAIRKATMLPLQIHLMVDEPTHWLDRLETNPKGAGFLQQDKTIPLHLQAPALSYKPGNMPQDTLFFHQETLPHENQQHEFIQAIHYKGFKAGIVINPHTAVETILNTLPFVDTVLLMSVEPGFSGQKFITEILKKIKPLVAFRQQHQRPLAICMDGGINENNINTLIQHEVDQIAVASAIFDTQDPLAALEKLYAHIRS